MREYLFGVCKGLLFLTIIIIIADQVVAGNVVHRLPADGSQFRIVCDNGKLVGPTQNNKAVFWKCEKVNGSGQPPVNPPVEPPGDNCPAPTHGPIANPERLPLLETGEFFRQISGKSTTIFRIAPQMWQNAQGRSHIGPHFAGGGSQSKLTTQTITECPGILDPQYVQSIDAGCFRSGQISLIRTQRGGKNDNCNLKPNTWYYLNISAWQPVTQRPTCTQCGIVHNIQ